MIDDAALISQLSLSITAIIGLGVKIFVDSNKNKSNDKKQGALELKVEALWEIYMMDAVKEARSNKLTQHNSADIPTEEFYSIFNGDLRKNIENDCKLMKQSTPIDKTDEIVVNIWMKYKTELGQFSESHEMTLRSLFGSIRALINEL